MEATELKRSILADMPSCPAEAQITNIRHLASYNWIDGKRPVIAVPGYAPCWNPPTEAMHVAKDRGRFLIAQNAFRHPDSAYEPLFRALFIQEPTFDLRSIDIVADRHSLRKLLSFVDAGLEKNEEAYTLSVEIVNNTAIICRRGGAVIYNIGPKQHAGYGQTYEKQFTKTMDNSSGHHRVVTYEFGGLNLLVMHQTDAYVATTTDSNVQHSNSEQAASNIGQLLAQLSLTGSRPPNQAPSAHPGSKLRIQQRGAHVLREQTLEIKTRSLGGARSKPVRFQDVAAQLWLSQTPNLVRAYHKDGFFEVPQVEDMTDEIKAWETRNTTGLRKFAALLHELLPIAKRYGRAVVDYDKKRDEFVIRKDDMGRFGPALPDDLYARWNEPAATAEGGQPLAD